MPAIRQPVPTLQVRRRFVRPRMHPVGTSNASILKILTGESSNPLDGVRDLITREGPSLFDPSNLGRIDDLFREAGSDVYERMGPILGEVRTRPDRKPKHHEFYRISASPLVHLLSPPLCFSQSPFLGNLSWFTLAFLFVLFCSPLTASARRCHCSLVRHIVIECCLCPTPPRCREQCHRRVARVNRGCPSERYHFVICFCGPLAFSPNMCQRRPVISVQKWPKQPHHGGQA